MIKSVRSRANNELLPHVLHMENVFKNSRRRLLKMDKVDGVLQSALNSEVSEIVPDDVDDDISEQRTVPQTLTKMMETHSITFDI